MGCKELYPGANYTVVMGQFQVFECFIFCELLENLLIIIKTLWLMITY